MIRQHIFTSHPKKLMASLLLMSITLFYTIDTVYCAATDTPSTIPVPQGFSLPEKLHNALPESILQQFTGMPYRDNGAVDEHGKYTLFNQPAPTYETPGFNCSGLVLQACRFLLRTNIPLSTATFDREGNSGPESPLGHDWDFGLDFILNVTEGTTRTILLPQGKTMKAEEASSADLYGFPIQDDATWSELLSRIQQGHIYLLAFNKKTARQKPARLFYHVGLLHKNSKGEVWMYQTTHNGKKANQRNLSTPKGLQQFRTAFADRGKHQKYVVVLEVALPDSKAD